MEPTSPPPQGAPVAPYRLGWWVLGMASLALLVLQSISWIEGRRAPQGMLNPAGLLCLSCGYLVQRQPLRVVLVALGILLMLAAMALRYLA